MFLAYKSGTPVSKPLIVITAITLPGIFGFVLHCSGQRHTGNVSGACPVGARTGPLRRRCTPACHRPPITYDYAGPESSPATNLSSSQLIPRLCRCQGLPPAAPISPTTWYLGSRITTLTRGVVRSNRLATILATFATNGPSGSPRLGWDVMMHAETLVYQEAGHRAARLSDQSGLFVHSR